MKNRFGDGQVAIRYKMRFRAMWQWAPIMKVHIFGVDFGERHLFGIVFIAVTENLRFYI